MRVGPVSQTSMGAVAVPHAEIGAWASNTGEALEGLEAEWLHKMSAAFASELQRSNGEDVSAPYVGD